MNRARTSVKDVFVAMAFAAALGTIIPFCVISIVGLALFMLRLVVEGRL